jgi:hypothetical protein
MAISNQDIKDVFTWVAAPVLATYIVVQAMGGRDEVTIEALQDLFKSSASSIIIDGFDAAVERRKQGLQPPGQPCPTCFRLDRA